MEVFFGNLTAYVMNASGHYKKHVQPWEFYPMTQEILDPKVRLATDGSANGHAEGKATHEPTQGERDRANAYRFHSLARRVHLEMQLKGTKRPDKPQFVTQPEPVPPNEHSASLESNPGNEEATDEEIREWYKRHMPYIKSKDADRQ